MEFWGVEVKSGESLKVVPGDGMIIHLSQKEKGNESVCLFVNVEGKKLVFGTLFAQKLRQQLFDLVFEREFELSHSCKNGSIYFFGYRARNIFDETEEDIPITTKSNGKHVAKPKQEKPAGAGKSVTAKDKGSDAGKKKVKIVEPKKEAKPAEDNETSDEDMISEDDDEEASEDDSDAETGESDEDTTKKAEPSKKRPAESTVKKPLRGQKAKGKRQKTDGKKPVEHVANPKSGGSHLCESCNSDRIGLRLIKEFLQWFEREHGIE